MRRDYYYREQLCNTDYEPGLLCAETIITVEQLCTAEYEPGLLCAETIITCRTFRRARAEKKLK